MILFVRYYIKDSLVFLGPLSCRQSVHSSNCDSELFDIHFHFCGTEQSVLIICQRGCSAYTPSCVSARGSQQVALR